MSQAPTPTSMLPSVSLVTPALSAPRPMAQISKSVWLGSIVPQVVLHVPPVLQGMPVQTPPVTTRNRASLGCTPSGSRLNAPLALLDRKSDLWI